MSKQEAGGERRGRALATNAAAPARPPSSRYLSASAQRDRQASPGALRDGGAGTSAAMVARPRHALHESVTFQETSVHAMYPGGEGRAPRRPGLPPVHGGGTEATAPAVQPRPNKPSYVPASQKRREQQRQAVDQQPFLHGSVLDERRTMPGLVGAPPSGPRPLGNGVTTTKTVEHVTTIKDDGADDAAASPGGSPPQRHEQPTNAAPSQGGWSQPQYHGQRPYIRPTSGLPGKSTPPLPSERKKRPPVAFCFTACCILFWLLVIAVGVAVLVVYLLYRPQPPRLRVTSATLNAGYVDELGRRLALNSDLTVLAAISSPNTKIDIVLRYMQLDLYFEGNMIGTQSVLPAPLHEGPGGSVLRSVHIVVSEMALPREDLMAWKNATSKGGPVALQLAGKFHTQLNFGRWLPYRYWVYPRCTLWLDPPPSGALRRVRC